MARHYDIEQQAWKKVKSIKRFYRHFAVFVIIGAFFFSLNVLTTPFEIWFYFPMLPWAAALAFHYLAVFGIPGTNILSKEWEETEFEKQMDKIDPYYKMRYRGQLESPDFEALDKLDLNQEKSYQPQYFKDDDLV